MELKKLSAFIGVGATLFSGSLGWAVATSDNVATNKTDIANLKTDVGELKTGIHEVYKQNVEIDNKLTDILHKQDKRLELLEYRVEVQYDK